MDRKITKKLFLIPICNTVLLVIYAFVVFLSPTEFKLKDLSIFAIISVIICFVSAVFCFIVPKAFEVNEKKLISLVSYGEYQFMQTNLAPLAFCERDGSIVWANAAFRSISGGHYDIGKNICGLFTEITKQELMEITTEPSIVMSSNGGKIYRIKLTVVDKEEFYDIKENSKTAESKDTKVSLTNIESIENITNIENIGSVEQKNDNQQKKESYIMVVCSDETEIESAKAALDNNKIVIGLIDLDNYEEIAESLDEFKISVLHSFVERKLSRFASENSGIIKRLEKDKFIFFLDKATLKSIGEAKSYTKIIDEIRQETAGTEYSFTMSIGVGVSGRTVEETYDFAKTALNLSLRRGGDQVAIKDGKDISFHGGREGGKEKTQRVRARIKAWSFKEILNIKERVFIMGHANADVDSFGAAVGVYLMASSMDIESYIVLNPDSITQPVAELMDMFIKSGKYSEKMFITSKIAIDLCNKKSMVVVVDHNNEKMSQDSKLLSETDSIAIFDHHRVGVNSIQGAVISYIEPNASSTCEMIAEMLEYFDDSIKLTKLEAETLLAGIVVDTNNFSSQTGARTFDVASFLKHNGAEVSFVKKLLRENFDEIKIVSDSITKAEIYKKEYAIASFNSLDSTQPLVTIALIANELIGARGIKASFSLTEIDNVVHISARSIGDVNVQIIMEELGGGGHHSSAATQIPDISIEEAIEKVKLAIDKIEIGQEQM